MPDVDPNPMPPKQWAQGKLTYIGLIITGVAAIARAHGWELPAEEAQGLIGWTLAHWDDIAQAVGLATAGYGRMRAEWRRHHPAT